MNYFLSQVPYAISYSYFLFIYRRPSFFILLFYSITMNLSNFDNHSKTLAFKNFKCHLYKSYLLFSYSIIKNKATLNQFLFFDMIASQI